MTSVHGARRGRRGPWVALVTAVLMGLMVLPSCARTSPPAGLMLYLGTNLRPDQYDSVEVNVRQQVGAAWNTVFDVTRGVPQDVTLPSSLFIESGASPNQLVDVHVAALLAGAPVVIQEAEVEAPSERIALLAVFLGEVCNGVSCELGETCAPAGANAGRCVSSDVNASSLPSYTPGESFDGGQDDATAPVTDATTRKEAGSDANPGTDARDECADGTCNVVCTPDETRCSFDGGAAPYCSRLNTATDCGGCGNACAVDHDCASGQDAGVACEVCTPTVAMILESSAPPAPAGYVANCGANPCPVVKCGRLTFWALADDGNDDGLFITGYDPSNTVVKGPIEEKGARYIQQITLNGQNQTATLTGQAGGSAITVPWSLFRLDEAGDAGDAGDACGGTCAPDQMCSGSADAAACVACTPSVAMVPVNSAPTPPTGLMTSCLADPCPVVECGQLTFWVFSDVDSDADFFVTGYNAQNAVVKGPIQESGDRYIDRISLNASSQTAALIGQAGGAGVIVPWSLFRLGDGSDAGDAGDAGAPVDPCGGTCALDQECSATADAGTCVACTPTLTTALAFSAPTPPSGYDVDCTANPCPVVKCGQLTFWVFADTENDQAFFVTGYDPKNTLVKGPIEENGNRYIDMITLDPTDQTATLIGQAGGTNVTVPWSLFRLP